VDNVRLIARLDVKGPNLIKGVHLEGLRIIGLPNVFARKYYYEGADEIIYMDVVASLYGRNHLGQIIRDAVEDIFIPLTVGGGIRSVENAREVLRSGADKVAVNTAAVKDPNLILEIAREFGSQCVVSSIEAKKISHGKWEVFVENGRERTGIDVVDWSRECARKGAGEILLTSIDQEGTRKGFDVDLVKAVASEVNVPIIASGGMGTTSDLVKVVNVGRANAVAMADILHYGRQSFYEIRKAAIDAHIGVRTYAE
jgi:cyclase